MSNERESNQGVELSVADLFTLKLPSVITQTFFGSSAATAEKLQRLSASATEKIIAGTRLEPDEQLAHEIAMAPLRRKGARLSRVVVRAAELIEKEPKLLPGHVEEQPAPELKPPPDEWTDRFTEGASLASDPHVVEIWARILAGQIAKPGSFSFKTMSVLRDVDTDTAQAFVRLLTFSIEGKFVPNWQEFVTTYDANDLLYPWFLTLGELGLLNFASISTLPREDLSCQGVIFRVQGRTRPINIHTLTQAGCELALVSDVKPNRLGAAEVGQWLYSQHGKLEFTPHADAQFQAWSPEALTS